MKYLSLFSGIGGLDLAAHWAGFSPVAFVEQDSFCQKVLAKHWPDTLIFDDVRTFNAAQFLGIPLIIGGFPCQDISAAGKGAGLEGERSGLWFEYLRIIKECQPRFVVAENVGALFSRGIDVVLCGLEEAGYAVEALRVGADDVGAPHARERWFIVGERNDMANPKLSATGNPCPLACGQEGKHSLGQRPEPNTLPQGYGAASTEGARSNGLYCSVANSKSLGQWDERQDIRPGGGEVNPSESATCVVRWDDRPGHRESLADSDRQRQPQSKGLISDQRRRTEHGGEELASFELQRGGSTKPGMGGAAHGLSCGMDFPGLLWPAGKGPFQYEWEAPRTVKGKQPGRAPRIKALGNAVVPAQALPVMLAIQERLNAK